MSLVLKEDVARLIKEKVNSGPRRPQGQNHRKDIFWAQAPKRACWWPFEVMEPGEVQLVLPKGRLPRGSRNWRRQTLWGGGGGQRGRKTSEEGHLQGEAYSHAQPEPEEQRKQAGGVCTEPDLFCNKPYL